MERQGDEHHVHHRNRQPHLDRRTYNAGAIATTGTVVMPPATTVTLSTTPATVVSPTSVLGNNTASWDPTLTVSLPSNAVAGTYNGTINTSVS